MSGSAGVPRRVHVAEHDRATASTALQPAGPDKSPSESLSRAQMARFQDGDESGDRISLQEVEALLDWKEREMASQFQHLRNQLAQVLGHQPHRSAASFTGWGGRSEPCDELGQTWGKLGEPMMGALWKNRELEEENRSLREAVTRRRAELQALNAMPAGTQTTARGLIRAQTLPLVNSTSNLSAASSSTTANGMNGWSAESRTVSPGPLPGPAGTPMFGLGPEPEPDLARFSETLPQLAEQPPLSRSKSETKSELQAVQFPTQSAPLQPMTKKLGLQTASMPHLADPYDPFATHSHTPNQAAHQSSQQPANQLPHMMQPTWQTAPQTAPAGQAQSSQPSQTALPSQQIQQQPVNQQLPQMMQTGWQPLQQTASPSQAAHQLPASQTAHATQASQPPANNQQFPQQIMQQTGWQTPHPQQAASQLAWQASQPAPAAAHPSQHAPPPQAGNQPAQQHQPAQQVNNSQPSQMLQQTGWQTAPTQAPQVVRQASQPGSGASPAPCADKTGPARSPHEDTKTKLEDALRVIADSIGGPPQSKAPSTPPLLSRSGSRKSVSLGRSESFPAIQPESTANYVEGCTPDVQGYGHPDVYRDWRKWHCKSDAEEEDPIAHPEMRP
mmetsp:Transcript_12597/g.29892  ORF Transcript_12597/g.29892 Transcript_12597/m.29892 type:complete len:616 (+) Transcript_12597:34-1881(+)